MRTDELDFELPEELIAQSPAQQRSQARLLHYQRSTRAINHCTFTDVTRLLRRGDLLVLNDARVLPARFSLRKPTGGHVEGLFLRELAAGEWEVMLKNVGIPKSFPLLHFLDAPDITMEILGKDAEGNYTVRISPASAAHPPEALLGRVGRMPLPPYIRRAKDRDERDSVDRDRYQTIYARTGHAVAAPTAGLHFTPEMFARLGEAGIEHTYVTLNVGLGTFKPVSANVLAEHRMHVESYTVTDESAHTLNRAKREGRRIVAVGTTAARVLESQPAGADFHPRTDQTNIFIYPPYHWKHVEALITNFHLPRSTLIALVAAFIGIDEQRRIYSTAIAERYRFFSYGDAMLLE